MSDQGQEGGVLRSAPPKEKKKRVVRLPDGKERVNLVRMSAAASLKAREARMQDALAIDFAALARKGR